MPTRLTRRVSAEPTDARAPVVVGSEWIRKRDGVRVVVAYLSALRFADTHSHVWLQFHRVGQSRRSYSSLRGFMRRYQPAPPRDLGEDGGEDGVESDGLGHDAKVRATNAQGE